MNPNVVYREAGWSGYGDWLGSGRVANVDKEFRPFHEARQYVHGLRLKSYVAWLEYCRSGDRPEDVPYKPERSYKDQGWNGWGDWLGTGNVANRNRCFRSFQEARQYVHELGLTSVIEWQAYAKSGQRPSDIPSSPDRVYKDDGWGGFGDWLGTGRVADRDKRFLPFDEAREYVQTLGLRTVAEWRVFSKSPNRPPDIPSTPEQVYREAGWAGFDDWLKGTSRSAHAAA